MTTAKKKQRYSTIQVSTLVKEQINDYCNRKGLKISRFIENTFLQAVSGSNYSPPLPLSLTEEQ